jgi:hypothetical protein
MFAMVIEEEFADSIALVMAAISVAFMVPALIYAFKIRSQITKALLVLAVSSQLYRFIFMTLGFASVAAIAHFIWHAAEYSTLPEELELLIHLTIDTMFILISISLFLTFKTAYGILHQKGSGARQQVEDKLRESALELSKTSSALDEPSKRAKE